MTRLESRSGPSGGSPPSHELFVCGRLCLLGEHSDWAGGFRSENPDVPVGKCLVLGTGDDGTNLRTAMWLSGRFPEATVVARIFSASAFARRVSAQCGFEVVSVAEQLQASIPAEWVE